jgi:hypothetical protein
VAAPYQGVRRKKEVENVWKLAFLQKYMYILLGIKGGILDKNSLNLYVLGH